MKAKPFRYRIVVEWSDEDEAFIARLPALPGCAAHGSTAEDATREGRRAAQAMLDLMRESGDPLPAEDTTASYSGQLRLRLPRSLHERLTRLASVEGVSLNQELVSLLSEGAGAAGRPPQAWRGLTEGHPTSRKPRQDSGRPVDADRSTRGPSKWNRQG